MLLPATPGWVSLPVVVGGPRHSWLGSGCGGGVWCVVCGVWRWCVGGVVAGVWCGWSLATPGGGSLCATPRHSWLGFAAAGGGRSPPLLAGVRWRRRCVVCGGGVLLVLWLVCGVVGPSPLLAEVPVCYSPPLLAGFHCRWWWAVPATPGWGPLAAVVCGVWCVVRVPRHSWRRFLCTTPRHCWLGFAAAGGGRSPPLLAGVRWRRWCACFAWPGRAGWPPGRALVRLTFSFGRFVFLLCLAPSGLGLPLSFSLLLPFPVGCFPRPPAAWLAPRLCLPLGRWLLFGGCSPPPLCVSRFSSLLLVALVFFFSPSSSSSVRPRCLRSSLVSGPGCPGPRRLRCLFCWPSASRLSVRLSLFRAFRLAVGCSRVVAAPPLCVSRFSFLPLGAVCRVVLCVPGCGAAPRCCALCRPVLCCRVLCCARLVPLLVAPCPLALPVALGPCALRRCVLRCSPTLCALCCVCFVVARWCVLLFAALPCAVCVSGCCAVRSLCSPFCAVLCFAVLVRSRCAVRVVRAVAGAWCCGALLCVVLFPVVCRGAALGLVARGCLLVACFGVGVPVWSRGLLPCGWCGLLWCPAFLCRVLWCCAVAWCCAVVLCCRVAVLLGLALPSCGLSWCAVLCCWWAVVFLARWWCLRAVVLFSSRCASLSSPLCALRCLVVLAVVPCFPVSCAVALCCRVVLCCRALLSFCGAVCVCFALLRPVVRRQCGLRCCWCLVLWRVPVRCGVSLGVLRCRGAALVCRGVLLCCALSCCVLRSVPCPAVPCCPAVLCWLAVLCGCLRCWCLFFLLSSFPLLKTPAVFPCL